LLSTVRLIIDLHSLHAQFIGFFSPLDGLVIQVEQVWHVADDERHV